MKKGNMEEVSFVDSSMLRLIRYYFDRQTLEVHFLSGSVYEYFEVPQEVFLQFKDAPSKGQFLNEFIKDMYPYARL